MSTTIDVQQPASTSTAEPTIADIVAQHLAEADAAGVSVVDDGEKPADGASEGGAPAAAPADTAAAPTGDQASAEPAKDEEPKADDVTAARVRKMLAKLEEREAALAERERQSGGDVVAELLKNPKAWLAKHGKSIDDVIDASIAEGKAPPAEDKPDDRVTALERRIEEREAREQSERQQAQIDAKKAEIARGIKGSDKFPLINETDAGSDVIDFMVEYHSIHGKPIAWDKAAALVEADLKAKAEKAAKKLGWAPPAAKPSAKPTDAPAARAGTVSLSGDQRQAAPTGEALPEDPAKLMAFLVRQAEAAQKTA